MRSRSVSVTALALPVATLYVFSMSRFRCQLGIALALFLGCSPSLYAQEDPAAAFVLDQIADEQGYGFTPEKPLRLGGRDTGQFRERLNTIFDLFRGPRGEPLSFIQTDSCCDYRDPESGVLRQLDVYEVGAEGYRPLLLYVDGYRGGEVKVPRGLLATNSGEHSDMIAIAERAIGFGDFTGASSMLSPLADEGDLAAAFALARLAADQGNQRLAYDWYLYLAEAGHPVAQAMVADLLDKGVGAAADQQAAQRWRHRAAEGGSSRALLSIARDLIGSGEDPDRLRAAADVLVAAAERGSIGAQAAYGLMLVNGRGVRQDIIAGLTWLDLARRQGDPNARDYYARVVPGLTAETAERIEANADLWLTQPSPPPAVTLPQSN